MKHINTLWQNVEILHVAARGTCNCEWALKGNYIFVTKFPNFSLM